MDGDTAPARALGMVLHHPGGSFAVRAIALDIAVYSTELVAADRLPARVVCAMRDAIAAGHDLQGERPELGMAGFRRCFPEVSERHARISWELYEPYVFDGPRPGSMDADRWRATIRHLGETHGRPTEEQFVRARGPGIATTAS